MPHHAKHCSEKSAVRSYIPACLAQHTRQGLDWKIRKLFKLKEHHYMLLVKVVVLPALLAIVLPTATGGQLASTLIGCHSHPPVQTTHSSWTSFEQEKSEFETEGELPYSRYNSIICGRAANSILVYRMNT